MRKESISMTRKLSYERNDKDSHFKIPRHSEVPETSYFDAQNLILNRAGIGRTRKRPGIQEMISKYEAIK